MCVTRLRLAPRTRIRQVLNLIQPSSLQYDACAVSSVHNRLSIVRLNRDGIELEVLEGSSALRLLGGSGELELNQASPCASTNLQQANAVNELADEFLNELGDDVLDTRSSYM